MKENKYTPYDNSPFIIKNQNTIIVIISLNFNYLKEPIIDLNYRLAELIKNTENFKQLHVYIDLHYKENDLLFTTWNIDTGELNLYPMEKSLIYMFLIDLFEVLYISSKFLCKEVYVHFSPINDKYLNTFNIVYEKALNKLSEGFRIPIKKNKHGVDEYFLGQGKNKHHRNYLLINNNSKSGLKMLIVNKFVDNDSHSEGVIHSFTMPYFINTEQGPNT